MTTLTYALKRGIESVFQLEESELAAEPLPDQEHRNAILFYEAAEDGAGVLHRLATDQTAIRRAAVRALEICHWRSRSGLWSDAADLDDVEPDCEAGCYRCLLSYANQPDHERIDRRDADVLTLLCRLARADTATGSAQEVGAEDAFAVLERQCGSDLERAWLRALREDGLRLPDRAQPLLSVFATQPDFAYDAIKALVYIDGPHHRAVSVKTVDDAKRQALREAGYKVIVFTEDKAGWAGVFRRYPFVFGGRGKG